MQTDSNRVLRRVVFLDRDGTLNVEVHYLSDPAQVELLPGVGEGLAALQRAGYLLVVLSNQSGIARGYFTEATLSRIHARLAELLRGHGATLDGIYYCPHAPDSECSCRKPKPGLGLRAAQEIGADLSRAVIVGDKACDIELGRALGCKTVLVRTGWGRNYDFATSPHPDFDAQNFAQATQWILQNEL